MTARRIKHARMLEHRANFFKTVNEGNLEVLNKVRNLRAEEQKVSDKKAKDAKIEKSKRLAKAHQAKPTPKEA